MTLPGLALFYGGLVRRKNVLSVLAQCLGITGLVTILWVVCCYSIAFHSGKPWFGNLDWSFLKGVDSSPNADYGGWVSHNVFSMYQSRSSSATRSRPGLVTMMRWIHSVSTLSAAH